MLICEFHIQVINKYYLHMNTEAIITMVLTQGIVIGFTAYFFYKVLTIKPKSEPDSFTNNDEEEERQSSN